MILTKEAQTLLRHICEMANISDADAIPSNAYLAEVTDWTPDEIRKILDPYDGLYVRAVRYRDLRPDEPLGVRYQLTEEGRRLCEVAANDPAP